MGLWGMCLKNYKLLLEKIRKSGEKDDDEKDITIVFNCNDVIVRL